jgi:hypothetical protein
LTYFDEEYKGARSGGLGSSGSSVPRIDNMQSIKHIDQLYSVGVPYPKKMSCNHSGTIQELFINI